MSDTENHHNEGHITNQDDGGDHQQHEVDDLAAQVSAKDLKRFINFSKQINAQMQSLASDALVEEALIEKLAQSRPDNASVQKALVQMARGINTISTLHYKMLHWVQASAKVTVANAHATEVLRKKSLQNAVVLNQLQGLIQGVGFRRSVDIFTQVREEVDKLNEAVFPKDVETMEEDEEPQGEDNMVLDSQGQGEGNLQTPPMPTFSPPPGCTWYNDVHNQRWTAWHEATGKMVEPFIEYGEAPKPMPTRVPAQVSGGSSAQSGRWPQPAKFSGDPKEDVGDALFHFETYLKGVGYDRSMWPSIAASLLTGNALTTYTVEAKAKLAVGQKFTWEDFTQCLSVFVQPDKALIARKELHKIKQTDTVASYNRQFNLLVAKAGPPKPTEADLLAFYWEGLKSSVKNDNRINPQTGTFWTNQATLAAHALSVEVSQGTGNPNPPFHKWSKLKGVNVQGSKGKGKGVLRQDAKGKHAKTPFVGVKRTAQHIQEAGHKPWEPLPYKGHVQCFFNAEGHKALKKHVVRQCPMINKLIGDKQMDPRVIMDPTMKPLE